MKSHKKKINKKLKIGLITIFVLIILGMGYLTYDSISNPGFDEKKIPLYTYNNSGAINYSVHVKPNDLYTGTSIGEGEYYLAEFVDYIRAALKYEFIGEDAADIKGSYNIILKAQGYTVDREVETNIWEKDFPIVKDKEITSKDGKLSINEKVDINLNDYNNFAVGIIEASKVRNSQARLILEMDVNIYGTTSKGEFEDSISPNLVIPLDEAAFQITGDSMIENTGAIEDTIKTKLPINTGRIIFYATIIGVLAIALIVLVFFTEGIVNKDLHEKEVNEIFKKHGDRLVALITDIEIENYNEVRTIEDLVRIADELDKPILYKYSENHKDINKFYLIDDEAYVLDISELMGEEIVVDNKDLIHEA